MENELKSHIEFLTAIRPFRNWLNRESLKVASDYIEKELKACGYEIKHQTWNVGRFEYTNVIASYKPELEQKLIVGAHYDVYSNQPGADDNTSGVAGLLKLAALIAENKPELSYGIEFVAFCLEEPPHFGTKNMGSHVHAKSLNEANVPVVGMVCLDMIGYFSDEPDSQHYPLPELAQRFGTVGNYIAVVGLKEFGEFSKQIYAAMNNTEEIEVKLINFPTNDGLAGLSDHRNYWFYGYNAVMINNTAKFRNPNYHEVTDTLDTLDLGKMAAVVRAVYQAISTPITVDIKQKPIVDKQEAISPKEDHLGFFARIMSWLRSRFGK